MALTVLQPTSNETPDATLGGAAVTGAANTGHASTVAAAIGADTELKSCRWFSFPAGGGQALSKTLKITHTSEGALSGAGVNAFEVDYTLNGGSSWTAAASRLNFTSAEGPTVFSVALPATQDLTLVQVRDLLEATGFDVGDAASVTATISDIQIELVTADANVIVIM